MVKFLYNPLRYLIGDFIGPIGSHDFHFLSTAPPERKEYLTLAMPFDSYTWGLITASMVGVSITLILINKMHATWSKEYSNESVFQCKNEIFI